MNEDVLSPIRPLLIEWLGPAFDSLCDDDNLIEQGLDSIRVMTIASALSRAGIRTKFAELAHTPTLRAWSALAAQRSPKAGVPEGSARDRVARAEPAGASADSAPAEADGEPFELALMQHAYWVGRGREHELGGVAAHFYNEFDGTGVDPDRLERALRTLLARHGQLRAVFSEDGRQRVPPVASWPGLRVHDWRGISEDEAERQLGALRAELSQRSLRVSAGEVFDVQLSLLQGGRTRLHLNLDMLAADALSLRILLADLAVLYRADGAVHALPPLDYSYRRYLLDRAASVERARERERDADWWRQRSPELPSAPALPVVSGPDELAHRQVVRRHRWLSPDVRRVFCERAHRHGITPAMALCAVFAEVLGAWSDEPRFLINVPLFDRDVLHPDVPRLVGDFTGSVLPGVDVSVPGTFVERASRVQQRFLADAAHASFSGVDVLRELRRAQGGRRVLAPVVFTSALNLGELFSTDVRSCFGDPVWIISQGPQVWLDAQVTELDGGLLVNWDALEAAFPRGVLDAMFGAFAKLVDSLVDDGAAWTRPVPNLLPDDQAAARFAANARRAPRTGSPLHTGFLRQVALAPERPALLYGDAGRTTYAELANRARRVAGALMQRGVQRGDRVIVALGKGPDQIAAVLGCLLAGACYVPLALAQPSARRDRIALLSKAALMLVSGAASGPLPAGVTALSVEEALTADPIDAALHVEDDAPAYTLFTSGSTGEPKGVTVSHRAAVNTIEDLNERFGIGPSDRTFAFSALDFDLSVYDLFGILAVGGAAVLVEDASRKDAARWNELMARHCVTVLNCVPSVLDMLLAVAGSPAAADSRGDAPAQPGVAAGLAALRVVLLGGDWVGIDLPGRLAAHNPRCRFIALGGTTETAIHSTICEVSELPRDWTSIPYGVPLTNVCCRVVDTLGRDCPDWVRGELWIGGEGVADGYLGDPERTRERFVFHAGTRWYRTGDLARYRPGAVIEFLGRGDTQVKLHGHRIELGEVEAAVEHAPGVGRAVAAVVGAAGSQLVAALAPPRPEVAGAGLERAPVGSERADALETDLVAHALRRALSALDDPQMAAGSLGNLVTLWQRWLDRHPPQTPLAAISERVAGTRLAPLATQLEQLLPALCDMLRGTRDPLELLDDPLLAPDALLDTLPAMSDAIEACARRIDARCRAAQRRLSVAVLGARGGRAVLRLCNALGPGSVELVLLERSSTELERARSRLAAVPHSIRYRATVQHAVPEELVGYFDAVVAVGSLHAHDDPAEGIVLSRLLLAPGGLLLAVEQEQLPPLGLITAAVPTRGFANADAARRAAGTPLLTGAAWAELLVAHGFEGVEYQPLAEEPRWVLCATSTAEAGLDLARVRAAVAERVPDYMQPERYLILPALPLTDNGKLDRKAVRELLGRHAAPAPRQLHVPPEPGLESTVAEVWRELLRVERVGRGDDFFALGGDSLLATRVLHRLGERGVQGGKVAALFTHPTLEAYASTLGVGVGAPLAPAPALRPDPEHAFDPFEPTDVQRAYWVGRTGDMPLGGVAAHYYSEFDGAGVDLARVERAWRRLAERHPMLRAVFDPDGRQRVLESVPPWSLRCVDVRALDAAATERELERLRDEMSHQVLDPSRWPLFDVRAVRYARDGQERTRLGLSLDNLVVDGLSMMIVFTELGQLYADPDTELEPIEVTFRDYLACTAPQMAALEAARAYWQGRLAALPPAPRLPLARDPATLVRPRFERRRAVLEARSWSRLTERAREHGVTPSALLVAAYADVLGYFSASPELTLNLTVFERREVHPHVRRVVGDFTSLLLVAYRPEAADSWLARVRRLQEQLLSDLDQREVSAVWVMREIARQRGAQDAAMPVVFTSALGVDERVRLAVGGGFPEPIWGVSQTPQVWLDLQVYEGPDGSLQQHWDAVSGLFPDGLIDALRTAFSELLESLAGGDWKAPRRPSLPPAAREVRARVNTSATPIEAQTLHAPFFALSAAEPDAPALWWKDGALSRGWLRDRALCTAAELVRRGVAPGQAVAISLSKGPDQIAAALGIVAAGAAYVPVGVDQPPLRRQRMLEAARARVVVDAAFYAAALPSPLREPLPTPPEARAYVIFTSGSTGEPKGVEVSHRAACNTVVDVNRRYGIGPSDRLLAVSALDFDLSVYDIFGVLGAGGSLVLVAEDERRDAQRWRDLCARHEVTLWNSVPMLLEMLLEASGGAAPPRLRLALVSGDWVPIDMPERLRRAAPSGCRLIALGGATEASIWSNAFDASAGAPLGWPSIPYGLPLHNQCFRVVNAFGEDCPDWVTGELWIGGAGVANGYVGDPERSGERFVEHGGQRWYRTGDLGRYHPDGLLEFLGRQDQQLKIRGHRLDLGEVDAALGSLPEVSRAVTVATGERSRRRLVSFVVFAPGAAEDVLLERLAGALPAHALPSAIVALEQLPLTSNGKVDRTALQERAASWLARENGAVLDAPLRQGVEAALAEAWSEVLGVRHVRRDADFFALGGDSLLATRLVAALERRGVQGASIGALLMHPVFDAYARTLRVATTPAPGAPISSADPEHAHDPFEMTDVQRAYWIGRSPSLVLGAVGSHYYSEADEPFADAMRIERALRRLIDRHPMLRAVFDADGRQRVLAHVPPWTLPVLDLRQRPPAQVDAELARTRDEMSHQVLDPARWPLFDARAVHYERSGQERTRLCISLDNLILDGLSMMIVFTELAELRRDPDRELSPIELTFRDYLTATAPTPADVERDRAHYRARLDELPPAPRLPLLRDPATVDRPRFTRHGVHWPLAGWRGLERRARSYGITPSVLLLGVYAEALAAVSTSPALTVNVTLFDRREVHPHVNRVVGDFTSLLLAAFQPRAGDSFRQRLRRLEAGLWADLDHRAVSAIWVMRQLVERRGVRGAAMPVVFTSALGLDDERARQLEPPHWAVSQTPQVWLDHQALEDRAGLRLTWDAVSELFPEGLVERLIQTQLELLERLAVEDWDGPAPDPGVERPDDAAVAAQEAFHTSRAIETLSQSAASRPPLAPDGALEKLVAELWAELLGPVLPNAESSKLLRRDRSFFALGGDSLLATRFIARLKERTGVEVALRAFFEAPTIANLAALLERQLCSTSPGSGLDWEEGEV